MCKICLCLVGAGLLVQDYKSPGRGISVAEYRPKESSAQLDDDKKVAGGPMPGDTDVSSSRGRRALTDTDGVVDDSKFQRNTARQSALNNRWLDAADKLSDKFSTVSLRLS